MADQHRMAQAEARLEGVNEFDPAAERVRTLTFGVPKRRQVERIDTVVTAESLADAVQGGARDDEAAEQDDRRSVGPPVAVGDQLPVYVDERPGVKCGRRLDGPRGC